MYKMDKINWQNKLMYFLIENDNLLEKYNTIWDRFGSIFFQPISCY